MLFQKVIFGNIVNKAIYGNIVNMMFKIIEHPVISQRKAMSINDWAVSIDLTDAYLHILIHPQSRKYLRFAYEDQVLQFTALP